MIGRAAQRIGLCVGVYPWLASCALLRKYAFGAGSHHGSCTYCPWCTDPILCSRQFLFVVATGRSGSTSIIGMANSIPGIFSSGENDNETFRLRQMFKEQVVISNLTNPDAYTQSRQSFMLALQEWVWILNQPPKRMGFQPSTVVGFKEIRWTADDVAFIQEVCPSSRFIVNSRKNTIKQAKSGFCRRDPDGLKHVDNANQRIARSAAAIPPDRVYRMCLKDFSVDEFNRLASWLGARCRFQGVTHSHAHGSYTPGARARCVTYFRGLF